MKQTAILLLAVAWGAGCAVSNLAAPTPDTALGLQKGSVFAVPVPPPVMPNQSAPGELKPVPPAYAGSPPVISHGIDDFVPITAKQNACLDCHAVTEKKPGEPTPVPPSHYTDLRNTPDMVGAKVAGARYLCVSCHVGTTDAMPLVQNRFTP
jgi:nitrate reductase cytochrome c-type subunit